MMPRSARRGAGAGEMGHGRRVGVSSVAVERRRCRLLHSAEPVPFAATISRTLPGSPCGPSPILGSPRRDPVLGIRRWSREYVARPARTEPAASVLRRPLLGLSQPRVAGETLDQQPGHANEWVRVALVVAEILNGGMDERVVPRLRCGVGDGGYRARAARDPHEGPGMTGSGRIEPPGFRATACNPWQARPPARIRKSFIGSPGPTSVRRR